MRGASLRVQSVLYRTDEGSVRRLVTSLAHSVDIARNAGLVASADLALGDSGQAPPSSHSVESLRALCGDAFGTVTVTAFPENTGHGGGHNRLLAEDDSAELLLVINPDTVAEPLLVARLVERFARPDVAVVEARQLPVEHPKDYDRATGTTPWASMACSMLRGSAVREVGLFDSDTFFLHGDDVDLSWRMRLAGWAVTHQPTARVFHDKRVGGGGYIEVGDAERVHGPLGSLLLAYKYSRDDRVAGLRAVLSEGTAEQREALRMFDERSRTGRLPRPRLDPEGRVASFVGDNFAPHRF